jgi:hypothetical protein
MSYEAHIAAAGSMIGHERGGFPSEGADDGRPDQIVQAL